MMINITEEQLREIVTQAHMAGQHNQTGCDPSYFEAEAHWQKQVKNIAYEPVLGDVCPKCRGNNTQRPGSATKHWCIDCQELF